MQTLEFIINGGETKRYHTWPVLREQRVDGHSFNVAMLCALMAQNADPAKGVGLYVPLLMAALVHDLAEHKMGDIPAPTKRGIPPIHIDVPGEDNASVTCSFREYWGIMERNLLDEQGLGWEGHLGEVEHRWLKLADAMDGALHCIRERMMGNKLIATVFNNYRSYITGLLVTDEEPTVMGIVSYIDDTWEQANGNS